jgi:threonyl-tRNA synthetase
MKILLLHCDYIRFKALKKALKTVEELSEKEKKEQEVKEALVVLIAVEKGDLRTSAVNLAENITDVAGQVKAKNIVLYPYAHLSKNLGAPDLAVEVMKEAEKILSKEFKVLRAPFGYYKEFELKVKGHPLSELSREIKIEGKEDSTEYEPKHLLKELSRAKLDTSKLKENDHRILGQQMDLFSFNESAPGMVFWHNNGLIIRNELIAFAREVLAKHSYQEISTPQILDKRLWQISGHWEKYRDNIFLTDYEKRTFAVKPMNCPGGMLVYKNSVKSYKDLPLKVGEFGIVHRQELSGVLGGLFRVIQFIQDDAHVFCTEDQLEEEINELIDLIGFFYSKFNLTYRIELSTRPEKRIGSDKDWDRAEKILESVLKKRKIKFKLNKGDGAFYGPKIDFHVQDSLEREWQLGTVQLDFSMPERFELEYTDKDNIKKRPVMLHRAIYGSLERFIGILIEHYKGRFPIWLAPIQVRVLTFTDRNTKYAQKIIKNLGEEIPSLRLDADFRQTTVQAKVKEAEIMRVPYIIVVGDKEEKNNTLAVRSKGNSKIEDIELEHFISKIKKEISERE